MPMITPPFAGAVICPRCLAFVSHLPKHTAWHEELEGPFEPEQPRVNTQEENIAFRKEWDARCAAGQKRKNGDQDA